MDRELTPVLKDYPSMSMHNSILRPQLKLALNFATEDVNCSSQCKMQL